MSLPPAQEDYVRIFSDGACSGNPGPGGWAFIMEHPASGKRIERSGAEEHTTNNRMEITSALQGLMMLKRPCIVELVTDSQYLAKGISEWLAGWRANGYKRREAGKLKPLINEDLWRAVDEQVHRHQIKVTHVKGHAGHPENERCDQLAVAAYKKMMSESAKPASKSSWTPTLPTRSSTPSPVESAEVPDSGIPEEEYYQGSKRFAQPEPTRVIEQIAEPASIAPPEIHPPLAETPEKEASVGKSPKPRAPRRKKAESPALLPEALEPVLETKPEKLQAAPPAQITEAPPEADDPAPAPKKRGRKPKAKE
jgi:ribonuclease HI